MTELTDQEKIDLLATKICGWRKELDDWNALSWCDPVKKKRIRSFKWNPLAENKQGLIDALEVVKVLEKQGWMWMADKTRGGYFITFYRIDASDMAVLSTQTCGKGSTLRAAIVEAELKIAVEEK